MSRLLFISALFLATALAGCAKGRGVVLVHVNDSSPSAAIGGIDHLVVTLAGAGNKMGGPYTVAPPSKPFTVPPEQTFSLSFGSNVSGSVTVGVEALATNGSVIAAGSSKTTVTPSHTVDATVLLTAGAVLPGPGTCYFSESDSTFDSCVFAQ
jgi:hypothetical protein